MRRQAIALLLAGAALPVHAQAVRLSIGPGSQIVVAGTSNVHDWKCSTNALTTAIVISPSAANELGKDLTSLSLSLPVRSLNCGNGQMNTNLAKAMHADQHPTISFRMQSYRVRPAAGGFHGTVQGALTINGVTRPLTFAAVARPDGNGTVRAEGSTSFSTRLFGIEPVKAMLGAIRTGENVTIKVILVGTAPVTIAAAPPPSKSLRTVESVPRVAATVPTKAPSTAPAKAPTRAPATKPAPERTATGVIAPSVVRDSARTAPRPMAPAEPAVAIAALAVPPPMPPVESLPGRVVVVDSGDVVSDTTATIDARADTVATMPANATDSERRVGLPALRIQHARPRDQRGLFLFEPPKQDTVTYTGFTLQWGAAFTQEMQGLHHSNTATPVIVAGVNQNQLMTIGGGFNNAVANLYLDVQVARGIRVALTSYLSSRHHSETWVKDGYFLIDASPIQHELIDLLMQLVTVKLGHFEVNYGDAHFRRTDNGQALHNPLIGNLILDAFTTEIGGEGYVRLGPVLAMAGLTGGEIRGQVTGPERRSPAWIAKLGIDRQTTRDLRVRLTGSTYGSAKSRSNTLYTGDRAGSPYFMVIENTTATEAASAWSGNIRPGFANVVHAYMVNPFVKYRGVEFFGTIETATGKAAAEARKRTVRQLAAENVVRFGPGEQLYVVGRYNRVAGQLAGIANDIRTNRWQAGGGWFLLPTVLAKVEYVNQRYYDFPASDIRNGARFHGFMVAGSVGF